MMAEGKVLKWTFCLLTILIASQFYLVQELLTAYAFFAIGFSVLTFVVLSLYLLQKGWEVAAVRIIDSERRMARGTRAAILAGRARRGTVKVGTGVENGKQELERLDRQRESKLGDSEKCVERICRH